MFSVIVISIGMQFQPPEQPADTLYMVGGGCQSAALRQKIADATGKRVIAGPVEATALGNIAVQLIHEGFITDHAQMTALICQSEKIVTAIPQASMASQITRLKQLKAKDPKCAAG